MAENPVHIYFVGTAGAGKSTMVAAYDRWCKQHGLSTVLVNLDPGVENLPYQPDIDIRDTVNLADVMEEHGLGPNGAQIAAADLIALQMGDLRDEIDSYRADHILIDTPGQIELFVFRMSGKVLIDGLNPERSVIAYHLDPYLARTAGGFASQLMLAATTRFRFTQPLIHLLTKKDAIDAESLETILAWGTDPMALETDILNEEPGMDTELATNVSRILDTMGVEHTLIPVTAQDDDGLDELYALIQATVGGSEDSTPEYDTFLPSGQADIDLEKPSG